jgi:hypothetical protein
MPKTTKDILKDVFQEDFKDNDWIEITPFKWYSEEELRKKFDDLKILYNNGDIGLEEFKNELLEGND